MCYHHVTGYQNPYHHVHPTPHEISSSRNAVSNLTPTLRGVLERQQFLAWMESIVA